MDKESFNSHFLYQEITQKTCRFCLHFQKKELECTHNLRDEPERVLTISSCELWKRKEKGDADS